MPARIGRHVPAELPGQRIEHHRRRQRSRCASKQNPEDRGKQQQQHDVERQHVHVDRLELEQQRLDDGDLRLPQKVQRVHLFHIERILEARGDIGNLGDIDREQEDMGDVDLPRPLQDARAGDDEAALQHGTAIDEGGRVAGYENEYFCRVAEAVVADREPAHDVVRDVVEKDQPERKPAKEIEPQVAFGGDGRDHVRRACSKCLWLSKRRTIERTIRVPLCAPCTISCRSIAPELWLWRGIFQS